MSNSCVVLINGPAGSGKDTLAKLCKQEWGGSIEKMSAPLKAAYKALVPDAELEDRRMKERHRQNLISLSEFYAKPRFGKGYFGKLLMARIKPGIVWVADSRFADEAMPLIQAGHKVGVVRIKREGCDWEKDSGRYINLPIATWHVNNNSTPEAMIDRLKQSGFDRWVKG